MNTFAEHSEQNGRQLSLSVSLKISSVNRCRERVRKERALFLKECSSTTLRDRDHVREARALKKANSKRPDLVSTLYAPQKKQNRSHKGVWRGVINTFMRNGSKLRYQTVLRKALLEL